MNENDARDVLFREAVKRLAAMLAELDSAGIESVNVSIMYSSGHMASHSFFISKQDDED